MWRWPEVEVGHSIVGWWFDPLLVILTLHHDALVIGTDIS